MKVSDNSSHVSLYQSTLVLRIEYNHLALTDKAVIPLNKEL